MLVLCSRLFTTGDQAGAANCVSTEQPAESRGTSLNVFPLTRRGFAALMLSAHTRPDTDATLGSDAIGEDRLFVFTSVCVGGSSASDCVRFHR